MSQLNKLKGATIGQPDTNDLKLISVRIDKNGDVPKLLGTGTVVCDGVDFYVLTAAHCFKDKEGNADCAWQEIELTLYDDNYKPTKLIAKGLELSGEDSDTAIIPIKTPPGGDDYFEKLRLLGQEISLYPAYVFGYTEKMPTGRVFTYKQVNSWVWANKDNITEKGDDFFKTVKGSSGGGVFLEINDRIYCMGFVKSTFDEYSTLDQVIVQPVNSFKNNWGAAYLPTIDDITGKPNTDGGVSPLQKQCTKVWREVYDAISRGDNLDALLPRLEAIRKDLSTPKNVNLQNEVMAMMFRRQEPWSEQYQKAFLMALSDKGLWLSMYGDNIPEVTNGIMERPLALKLEKRAVTLTKAPLFNEEILDITQSENYDEMILRCAFALDFDGLKKLVDEWQVSGFWTARKALWANLFGKNKEVLKPLHDYLKDGSDDVLNEKFIATVVYNVVNGDFMDRVSYERFLENGLDGISTILAYITDQIEQKQEKVKVYGIHQRYIIGGEDTKSLPEALRLIRTIIEAGVLPNFRFTSFLSGTNWLKVVRTLFCFMPYPMIFYSLLYTDEKLLKRVGQEYAFSDDEDVIKALPDIQQRLLSAIGKENTPRIYIGLYLITSELYVALKEEVWYGLFRDNVLKFFCRGDVVKNVSYRDPICVNVMEGLRYIRSTERRVESFKILVSALSLNPYVVSAIIHDCLYVDEALMRNGEFLASLKDVISTYPLKETYLVAGKFGYRKDADEELRLLIEEVAKKDKLDFGSETDEAICVLSYVVRDAETRARLREILLRSDMWYCGISDKSYTDPHPIGLETADKAIGWSTEDWSRIKDNMLQNIALMTRDDGHSQGIAVHFRKQYIKLLSEMNRFIEKLTETGDFDVADVKAKIDSILLELRKYGHVGEALSSTDYEKVVDGVWNLRDRFVVKGVEGSKDEIALLINRCMIQAPTALEHCISLLAAFVEDKPKEMIEAFAPQLLMLLKRYAQEFDYQELFVKATAVYAWMRQIARALFEDYKDDAAVQYWLEDAMVNRFNYVD